MSITIEQWVCSHEYDEKGVCKKCKKMYNTTLQNVGNIKLDEVIFEWIKGRDVSDKPADK